MASPSVHPPATPPTASPSGAVSADSVVRLRLVVARLARLLRQQDDSGLGPTLTAALSTVAGHGPLTLGDLAARERVAPPTITKVVDKMESAGYVERRPHPVDRRVSLVAITDLGTSTLAALRDRRTAWLRTRMEELPDADVQLVERATAVLEQIIESETSG